MAGRAAIIAKKAPASAKAVAAAKKVTAPVKGAPAAKKVAPVTNKVAAPTKKGVAAKAASQVTITLKQIAAELADGHDLAAHHADAAVIVAPRSTAVASETFKTDPTPRDRHLTCVAERGRIGWQKASGYDKRSRVEATIGRFKQVIGNGLRSQIDIRQDNEVAVAIRVLNRMLAFGRPQSVRIS